ncbi:helix-turn-helix transcriptional regulator [Geodermatophilus normandii]|uniref:AAA family ATPase n=1 Tax=Geodermatophilus normandii TaxID=1137989 RepID=A0A6P0GG33_9ACTN|nr:LuxR family transcriptional regulator [Geodermatophilus normandii]NEM06182.1 AAA family ATPase [Geodermatophilus normandii]
MAEARPAPASRHAPLRTAPGSGRSPAGTRLPAGRRTDAGPRTGRPPALREGVSAPAAWPGLVGRSGECERLGDLIAATVAGRSQVLVVRGEAGIGKSALLRFLAHRATGCRVARAAGVESELEMAFAGLHQLCHPFLDRLPALPGPQREALGTAFGLRPGGPPDRFLVGLAVLTLLSEVAEERPLVCVVDDVQWLDQASVQALEFVARRLAAEPVALVLGARGTGDGPPFARVPQLVVGPLADDDAASLLRSAVPGALDPRVRDRVLAECRGNPLALLELHRGASAAELAFGDDAATAGSSLVSRLEQGFAGQLHALPRASRQLLLVAAAEPVGDVRLLQRAAARLGIGEDAVSAAESSGLVELGERVRFRHPLVRSAVRHAATRGELRQVHRVLADVTHPGSDPDRRAWHRAQATVGTDEAVAADLERSAGRALAQGGLASTAAFLERAALLTPDPAQRVRRALDAAQAKVVAGAFDDASALLATARTGPLGEAGRARAELLEAQMRSATSRAEDALPLLLAAARRLEPLDADLARDTYLDALSSALTAGPAGPDVREVARVVREAPPPGAPRSGDLLLEALAVLVTEGYAAAAPVARQAVQAFLRDDPTLDEALRLTPLAASTAVSLWDDASWDALTRRHVAVARESGAVGALPLALGRRLLVPLLAGDLTAANALVQQVRSVEELTGGRTSLALHGEAALAAHRGRSGRDERVVDEALDAVEALLPPDAARSPAGPVGPGATTGATTVHWARAVLCNGLGRYADAVSAAREATAGPLGHGPSSWALAELVEAGARSGDVAAATAALESLSAVARASGAEWALGVAASRRALLCGSRAAEELHREAVDRLAGTRVQVELARARLLYGEWLRREGRRVDARAQLRTAHEAFAAMGAEAFAERARRELQATGETVRRRAVETAAELTAQEAQVARLAARGHTNSEIAAALYISPRTVEWHLRKVFGKLGITTRRDLWRSPLAADRVPT